MSAFNIFMIGVGGQGIGLLSEVLLRAADAAGLPVVGCDTHGLAQRGGTVVSHLRVGDGAHSPLVEEGAADLVLALERHEALRAMRSMLRDGGAMAWYDASWQPLDVRMGAAAEVRRGDIEADASARGVAAHRVFVAGLGDPRMQNVAVLAEAARRGLVPGVAVLHYEQAMEDLMDGPTLEANRELFHRQAAG
jgi:indolepyruvate ferredoxin oxidoreductase, beta subunit